MFGQTQVQDFDGQWQVDFIRVTLQWREGDAARVISRLRSQSIHAHPDFHRAMRRNCHQAGIVQPGQCVRHTLAIHRAGGHHFAQHNHSSEGRAGLANQIGEREPGPNAVVPCRSDDEGTLVGFVQIKVWQTDFLPVVGLGFVMQRG